MAATPKAGGQPIELTIGSILMASALMVIVMLGSIQLKLGLEKSVLIGTIRTVAQLTLLGYVLSPIQPAVLGFHAPARS